MPATEEIINLYPIPLQNLLLELAVTGKPKCSIVTDLNSPLHPKGDNQTRFTNGRNSTPDYLYQTLRCRISSTHAVCE